MGCRALIELGELELEVVDVLASSLLEAAGRRARDPEVDCLWPGWVGTASYVCVHRHIQCIYVHIYTCMFTYAYMYVYSNIDIDATYNV